MAAVVIFSGELTACAVWVKYRRMAVSCRRPIHRSTVIITSKRRDFVECCSRVRHCRSPVISDLVHLDVCNIGAETRVICDSGYVGLFLVV